MSQAHFGDLRLVVSQEDAFPLDPYDRFLTALTRAGGAHQREALVIAMGYLLGTRYPNLTALAEENWARNERLRGAYKDQKHLFLGSQQFGSLLAGSIDHATATGKSYIIFGAAMIALASGFVDRVLVLCPSVTIEEGLTKKFAELADQYSRLLPDTAVFRNPAIVNAYEVTVPPGSICIENIHSAYKNSLSSMRVSFRDRGSTTLVINDEAHHVYTLEGNAKDKAGGGKVKEWFAFLTNPDFRFHRVLNLSGTCFVGNGNDYFPDVIHRYSVLEARDQRRIKDVRYWAGDGKERFPNERARWEATLKNHRENIERWPGIKPITIFVTNSVKNAIDLHREFTKFLADAEKISVEAAAERTLAVSSDEVHKKNLPLLRTVDQTGNKVEFIVSVSMLTEGWDVKNVLQIVPQDERAFNSRLLISQVLGRGLRLLPNEVDPGREAAVTVFNHPAWAPQIRQLFDDIWEIDERVYATPVAASKHHFEVVRLEVERGNAVASPAAPAGRAAGLPLVLGQQRARETSVEWATLRGPAPSDGSGRYSHLEPVVSLDSILDRISLQDQGAANETRTRVTNDLAAIRADIEAALTAKGITDGMVSESNGALIFDWLRPVVSGKRVAVVTLSERLVPLSTRDIRAQSVGYAELSRGATVALRTDNDQAVRWDGHSADQYELLDRIVADESLPRPTTIFVTDERRWRTPVDVVIVRRDPERRFLAQLLGRDADSVTAWVKSPDTGFYSLPFAITQNGDTHYGNFNPDWILRVGDDTLIVETKENDAVNDENRAKVKGAHEYVRRINELRADLPGVYRFFMLTPNDYTAFFKYLKTGSPATFEPLLETTLAVTAKPA